MRLYISAEHAKRLPTIRIQKIVIKDFKNVENGEVVFECGRQFVPYGTKADILGLYGQNGSGKTTLVEACSILKQLLMGEMPVNSMYVDDIAVGSEYAQLEFLFELQYADGRIRNIAYSFKMGRQEEEESGEEGVPALFAAIDKHMDSGWQVKIYDELIKMSGDFYGEKIKSQPIIDTSSDEVMSPFLPASKRKYFIGEETREKLIEQMVNKRMALKMSQSFVFSERTVSEFNKYASDSEYFEVIKELRIYAAKYLYVIDTKFIGASSQNLIFPLYSSEVISGYNWIYDALIDDMSEEEKRDLYKVFMAYGMPIVLSTAGSFSIPREEYESINAQLEGMSAVIEQIIPGMRVKLKALSAGLLKNGSEKVNVELISIRDNVEMPFRCESDGVKKIISVLALFMRAYNQKSTTVVIDEFDAGVFEYLLGELLSIFETGGLGQLIFTSHNLRPLEVLDKKYLCFTTTNPQNRYIRLKHIGASNNLRNIYYREIERSEQDEELYNETQQSRIGAAMRKAGKING